MGVFDPHALVCRRLWVCGCIWEHWYVVEGCTAHGHRGVSPLRSPPRQHSNTEFPSVAALLAHYSAAPGGCFCRLAPGRRNPGYEEQDPSGGASTWGDAAWAPTGPVGAQHERG